jgi:hypothetical protein
VDPKADVAASAAGYSSWSSRDFIRNPHQRVALQVVPLDLRGGVVLEHRERLLQPVHVARLRIHEQVDLPIPPHALSITDKLSEGSVTPGV